jgi:hypothetical protein
MNGPQFGLKKNLNLKIMAKQLKTNEEPEIVAISDVYAALKDLDAESRGRVLSYVAAKFGIAAQQSNSFKEDTVQVSYEQPVDNIAPAAYDELEGISPIGKKWITRSGIRPAKLMSIFSLGIDEIDLVCKSVPGATKSKRMRNVFLLKGIAAYLGTGAARFTHEQVKETSLHYDAWDGPNFANIYKTMSADISGSKEIGYTLTAKGISEATALIKSISGAE